MPNPPADDELVEITVTTVIELSPAVTFAEALREAIFHQPGAEAYPEAAEALYDALISHPDLVALLERFPAEVSVDELVAKVDELLTRLLGENVADLLKGVDSSNSGKPDEYLDAVWQIIAPLWPEEDRGAAEDRFYGVMKSWVETYSNWPLSYDENWNPYLDEEAAWQAFTDSVIGEVLAPQNSLIPPLAIIALSFDEELFGGDMAAVAKLASWRPVAEAEGIEALRQALAPDELTTMHIGEHTVPVPFKEHFQSFLEKMEERQGILLDLWIDYFGIEGEEGEKDPWALLDEIQDRIAKGLTPVEFLLRKYIEATLFVWGDVIAPKAGLVSSDAEEFLKTFPKDAIVWGLSQGIAIAQLGSDLEAAMRIDLAAALAGIAAGMGYKAATMLLDFLVLANTTVEGLTGLAGLAVGEEPLDLGLDELVVNARVAVRDKTAGLVEKLGLDPTAYAIGFEGGNFAMSVSETFVATVVSAGPGLTLPAPKLTGGLIRSSVQRGMVGAATLENIPALVGTGTVIIPRSVLAQAAFAAMTTGPGDTGQVPPEKPKDGGEEDVTPAGDVIPDNLQEIFDDPSTLAGKDPRDVEHLFPPDMWDEAPVTGRSPGTKFTLKGTGFQVRYSSGETKFHFQGPYWHIGNDNGNPPQIWIGPDGTMYTEPPLPLGGGKYSPGTVWSGELKLSEHVRDLIFGQ
jgi:hypothetical protein